MKTNDLRNLADQYVALQRQIAPLSKQAEQIKKILVSEASLLDQPTLDLGSVVIDRRQSITDTVENLTPHQVWECMEAGIPIKFGIARLNDEALNLHADLLRPTALDPRLPTTLPVRLHAHGQPAPGSPPPPHPRRPPLHRRRRRRLRRHHALHPHRRRVESHTRPPPRRHRRRPHLTLGRTVSRPSTP